MKILVTGGLGFIGSHLCESLLLEKHTVIILTRNLNTKSKIIKELPKVKIEKVDVTNFQKFSNSIKKHKPNVIFHLAGETSHQNSFENPMYDVDVNTKSTLCILETIKNFLPKCKLIIGSTFIVIGKPEKLPVNENSKCTPTTIYGANRLTSEHLSNIYHNVYGLDTIIFRITNCFGPREQYKTPKKNALNYLIYQSYDNKKVTIYNQGKFFRDIIFISDVISALKTILKNGKSGELYWISSGKKTWFYNIGKYLEKFTNAPIVYKNPPLYTKKVDVGNFVADNSKLKSLGWNLQISVKDGIEQTLNYFKSNSL
jgi:UDP-glucose 4-epimerase